MDDTKLTEAISIFRQEYPGFRSFKNPGSDLAKDELDYKRELSRDFKVLGRQLLDGGYETEPGRFLEEFRNTLKKKLESSNQPQNLAGWRDIDPFFEFARDSQRPDESVRLIQELLQSAEDSDAVSDKINQFTEWLFKSKSAGRTRL